MGCIHVLQGGTLPTPLLGGAFAAHPVLACLATRPPHTLVLSQHLRARFSPPLPATGGGLLCGLCHRWRLCHLVHLHLLPGHRPLPGRPHARQLRAAARLGGVPHLGGLPGGAGGQRPVPPCRTLELLGFWPASCPPVLLEYIMNHVFVKTPIPHAATAGLQLHRWRAHHQL